MFEEHGGQGSTDGGEELFGLLTSVIVFGLVISRGFALGIVPMSDGVNRAITGGPFAKGFAGGIGDFLGRNATITAMLATEPPIHDITRQERKQGSAAAG